MASILERGRAFLGEAFARLSVRRDRHPIRTVDDVAEFARTRASFVTQHKLYGYLKTRMGTRYPTMFEDEVFVGSINIAKEHVFAACLSDLVIHCVAHGLRGAEVDDAKRRQVALYVYGDGIDTLGSGAVAQDARPQWEKQFGDRLADVHWGNVAAGASSFTESPRALVKWAPIAPEHKKYDRAIVENSVRYAWNEVIRDFRLRLDGEALRDDAIGKAERS